MLAKLFVLASLASSGVILDCHYRLFSLAELHVLKTSDSDASGIFVPFTSFPTFRGGEEGKKESQTLLFSSSVCNLL